MSSKSEFVAPFPDVIDVDMLHLLNSGCLDAYLADPLLGDARATLALTEEVLLLPRDDMVPANEPSAAQASLSAMDIDTSPLTSPASSPIPSSPEIPLSVLALTKEAISLPRDDMVPANEPSDALACLSAMDIDMSPLTSPGSSPILSSPEIPLSVISAQRKSQQQVIEPTSSQEVPLSAGPEVRVTPPPLQQAPLAEVPVFDVAREPDTYFAGLIPHLHRTGGPSFPPPPNITPAQVTEPQDPSRDALNKAKHIWREWQRMNRRKAQEALKNPVTLPGIRLSAFADAEQREWTQQSVPEDGPRIPQPGPHARVLLGEDGVPIGWVFPNFLGDAAHDILFRELQQFAEDVEITPDKRTGADSNTRNKRSAYKRAGRPGERSGCYQLVNIWGAIGHPDGQLGPSTDVVCGTVREFNAAAKLMEELGVVSKRIDHLIQCIDPDQHAEMHKARRELCDEFPAYNLLSQLDPSYFHGRSLIYNRATPRHKDIRDKKFAWTPVLTLGNYTSGTFKVLNQDIEYLPRTLILLRGAVFPHEVTYSGGMRVCIAHFTHEYVLNRTSVGALPLMTASDVAAHLEAIRQKNAATQRPKNNNPKKARRRKDDEARKAAQAAD